MQNGSLRGPREDTLPNAIQEDPGRTALHEAATVGDEKTLQVLLAAGADRNAKDSKHGNTALHEAAWRGFSRCVKALCTLPQPKTNKDVKESKLKGVLQETRGALHSALLGCRNGGGFSALHLAAQNGHNQSCREILLAGADPDVQNNYGDTPLHTACRYGHAGATRILISAKCDPNRTNLNKDTALHIACAMGRRKLTRILIEAGTSTDIKNAQGENPRDIAIRKNLPEILEILDNPVKKGKSTKDRERSSSNSNKNGDKVDGGSKPKSKSPKRSDMIANQINWSPYGCHYFPDPRSFPSPKLETLPKEPLGKGEQYYLDLAGNIRKGPIGVGNTCYCGPFFRHIEERISRNRKSLRKYVHKATERLDNKVQALALRTDDQIEQLTRSMMVDRIRCEGRRLHLEQWLRRGDPIRSTVGHNTKSKKNIDNVNTLTRCRSLELLDDDDISEKKIQNSRSFDILDETDIGIQNSADSQRVSSLVLSSDRKASKSSDRSRSSPGGSRFDRESFLVSERLEELLTKTNEILELEKIARRRKKESNPSKLKVKTEKSDSQSQRRHCTFSEDLVEQFKRTSLTRDQPFSRDLDKTEFIAHEMEKITSSLSHSNAEAQIKRLEAVPAISPEIAKDFSSQKESERRSDQEHEKSSILSGSSHKNPSSAGSGYIPDFSGLRVSRTRPGSAETAIKSSESSERPSPLTNVSSHHRDYQNLVEAHEADAEHKFKTLLSALRKDYNATKQALENEILKESPSSDLNNIHQSYSQSLPEEDLVDGIEVDRTYNGFYHNSCFDEAVSSSNNTLKSENRPKSSEQNCVPDPEDTTELSELANINEINELKSRILNGSNWRSQVLKKTQQLQNRAEENAANRGINSTVQKVEIKNSEVKTLKTPTSGILRRSKVQELVAKIQGDSPEQKENGDNSESSEDEQEGNGSHVYNDKPEQLGYIPNGSYYYYNRAQPQVPGGYQQNINTNPIIKQHGLPPMDNSLMLDTRNLIPKDAYFHELPNKNRMRPIVDKLPEKQMINFTDQYPVVPNQIAPRTRNPLPYYDDYTVPIVPEDNNTHNNYDYNNTLHLPHQNHIPQVIRQVPHREKLLSSRKFGFSSAVDQELSRINYTEHHHQVPLQMQHTVSITPEQAQIDRDMNNDSGYSTKICGSSHGPSPSLSGHTDYGIPNGNLVTESDPSNMNSNGVTYFLGNVGASSLV